MLLDDCFWAKQFTEPRRVIVGRDAVLKFSDECPDE